MKPFAIGNIGSAGLLVTAVLVACSLGPEPDPGPVVGIGRIEREDLGFAVTVPHAPPVHDITGFQSQYSLVLAAGRCYLRVDGGLAGRSLDDYVARLTHDLVEDPVSKLTGSVEVNPPPGERGESPILPGA